MISRKSALQFLQFLLAISGDLGQKMGHIGTKWDKFGSFSHKLYVHFILFKMDFQHILGKLIFKSLKLVPFIPIWLHLSQIWYCCCPWPSSSSQVIHGCQIGARSGSNLPQIGKIPILYQIRLNAFWLYWNLILKGPEYGANLTHFGRKSNILESTRQQIVPKLQTCSRFLHVCVNYAALSNQG